MNNAGLILVVSPRIDKRPPLDFPAAFLKGAGSFGYGGTTVDGETFKVNPLAPRTDAERW